MLEMLSKTTASSVLEQPELSLMPMESWLIQPPLLEEQTGQPTSLSATLTESGSIIRESMAQVWELPTITACTSTLQAAVHPLITPSMLQAEPATLQATLELAPLLLPPGSSS